MNPNDLILSSSNWGDFFDRVSAQDETKDKGDVFERFTQLYLQRLLISFATEKSLEA